MKITYTKTSNTHQCVELELVAEEFEEYLSRAAKELSKDLNIPGFRKGSAPRNIIEQKVGASVLYNEAADIAMQHSYRMALGKGVGSANEEFSGKLLKEIVSKFPRHTTSNVQVAKLAPSNPFIDKIDFVLPYLEMGQNYKELALKVVNSRKRDVVVEDKEVADTLDWLRRNHRDKPRNGESNSAQSSSLEGEKDEDLPELNDDFAKTVGSFKNVEDLKKSIRDGIRMEKEKKEKDAVRVAIIKEIVDNSKEEIPKEIIEAETVSIENEFKENIAQMGLEFDDYIGKIKKKREDFLAGWEESARERVKTSLVLDAVADREDIKPSGEEVQGEVQKILARYANVKEAEKSIDPVRLEQYVYNTLRNEKVLEFLENAD